MVVVRSTLSPAIVVYRGNGNVRGMAMPRSLSTPIAP